jgi:hypothetical protein
MNAVTTSTPGKPQPGEALPAQIPKNVIRENRQQAFTLARIADAAGLSKSAVQYYLKDVAADSVAIVNGNVASAWLFSTLPARLQEKVEACARATGCADGYALLCLALAWTPRVRLADAPQTAVEEAAKRRAALLPFLDRLDREDRSQAQLEADGIAAWQREFGAPISGRRFRQWVSEIARRAATGRDWSDLELYMSGKTPRRKNPAQAASFDHSPLSHRFAFANPSEPSREERQLAFAYAFAHLQALCENQPNRVKDIRKSVFNFMWTHAPALAKSRAALKRNFDRLFALWKEGGRKPSAIADQRATESGNFRIETLEADLQLITAEAWRHDGKVSIAIRKLRRENKLSARFIQRYTIDPRRNKSYVAASIRKEIKSRLSGLLAHRAGLWRANMAGPRIARDHSGYRPGDFFAADDCTFNIYWHYTDDAGRPAVARGQVLLFIDCRSFYPLGYVMVRGSYTGETIRRGMLHIHDRFGLPHRAFIFEKGAWESRLLKGENRTGFLGWSEYEMALAERGLGVELRNVTTPGAKLIETVFNPLQQNQRNLPGFIGFNEREYGQEKLQEIIGRVRRGTCDPAKYLLSEDQWMQELDRTLDVFMHEPQTGDLLRGQTPAEAFQNHAPLRKLSDNERFLLSTHRVRASVKPDGLTITIRGKRRAFYNEELSRYMGREVYAWFNIEAPELLTVSDLEMKNHFSVRQHILPAFDATPEQLRAVNRDRAAFNRSAKLRVDAIKHPVRNSITRDNLLDPEQTALGARISAETARFNHALDTHDRAAGRAVAAAREMGMALDAQSIRNPENVLDGIEMLKSLPESPPPPAPRNEPILTAVDYWRAWNQLQAALKASDGLRHQLTRKHLSRSEQGHNPHVSTYSQEELRKMISVFKAVLRDGKALAV